MENPIIRFDSNWKSGVQIGSKEISGKSHVDWNILAMTFPWRKFDHEWPLESWKSGKSWNSWFLKRSGSQDTVSKPQSAVQTRNVEITCRGEDSPSVSNTQPGEERPEKAGGFRGTIDIEFQDILKSYHLFLFRLKVSPPHKKKLCTCTASAQLKHSS